MTYAASLRALADLHSNNWMDSAHRAEWVRALHRGRKKLKIPTSVQWNGPSELEGFFIPTDLDLAVWAAFLSTAHFEECEAVLLSHMIGFSDMEIATGLGVSEGTVRYRVGRGLRHLGGYLES